MSGCDYLLSRKILYFLALPSLLHPSILFNYFLHLFLFFFIAWVQLLYSKYRWEVPKLTVIPILYNKYFLYTLNGVFTEIIIIIIINSRAPR